MKHFNRHVSSFQVYVAAAASDINAKGSCMKVPALNKTKIKSKYRKMKKKIIKLCMKKKKKKKGFFKGSSSLFVVVVSYMQSPPEKKKQVKVKKDCCHNC